MKKIFVFSSYSEKSPVDLQQYEERHFAPEFIFTDEPLCITGELKNIIKKNYEEEHVIISTSQHQFCSNFSQEYLESCIDKVKKIGGNLLLGGLLSFEKTIEATDHIFWVDGFKGSQFLIIFKKTFPLFLHENSTAPLPLDVFLSSNLEDVFVMHPFISHYNNDGNIQSFENTIDFQNLDDNPEDLLDELSQIKKYYSYES
ncbi:hypothetical protein [Chryseobacterium sp. T20]|uniref:hypothetical protein n=1 Tax=Chryseobacterium sp. T20 TaxID=3395375 RepID=UPI0039BD72E5